MLIISFGDLTSEATKQFIEKEAIQYDCKTLSFASFEKRYFISQAIQQKQRNTNRFEQGKQIALYSKGSIQSLMQEHDLVLFFLEGEDKKALGEVSVIAQLAREKNLFTMMIISEWFTFGHHDRLLKNNDDALSIINLMDAMMLLPIKNFECRMVERLFYHSLRGGFDFIEFIQSSRFLESREESKKVNKISFGVGQTNEEGGLMRAVRSAVEQLHWTERSNPYFDVVFVQLLGSKKYSQFRLKEVKSLIVQNIREHIQIILDFRVDETLEEDARVLIVGFEE